MIRSRLRPRQRPARLALLAPLALTVLIPLAQAAPLAAQPPARLTLDDLFDEERTGRTPRQVAWRPDGGAVSYLWDAGAGEALWEMDARTGAAEPLFTVRSLEWPEDLGDEPSVDAYHWAPDGAALLLESAGDLFLWRREGGLERLTATEADEEAPAFAPGGGRIAYVREADLYLMDLAPGPEGSEPAETALTTDGEPGTILNGTTDWVYYEEIWGRDPTGFWWGPEGERIAYYRFDDTPVGELTLLPDPVPVYPEPKVQRYPKAGTDNPGAKIGVLELSSGETTWLDTAVPPARGEVYPARIHWIGRRASGSGSGGGSGPAVAVERLNREQTDLDLLVCRPDDGSCRTILTEHRDTWVNLGDDTTFLEDGRFLWTSERSGWRHLELYGPDGTLERRLTSGDWAITSLDHAGPDAAIVTAHGTGPLGAASRRVLRVPYDGTPPVALTSPSGEAGGWHSAKVSPDGTRWIHGWSDADHPGWERIETLENETVAGLPSEPPAYDPETLPRWTIFTIPGGGDGETELPAALLLPPGIDPEAASESGERGAEPHPVIMYHYGCPASQVVADRWSARRGLWHKLMAQRGYVVLMVDNRGSTFFGKAGEDRAHRRFGPGNLAAQQAGVEHLEGLAFADPERIGLWGWSGGGSNTLYALLNAPGTWKAGVAGAPVTDWRYYDTIWTERYLDHPEDNPEGYEASSPVTYAENLEDALLIVHGTADDNVHPQNTFAMVDALVEAGKPFEMAIYPDEKHGFGDRAGRHFYERMTEFFARVLRAE